MIGVAWSTPAIRHPPFLVCGMPRARTTWIAKFLSYGDTVCEHEPSLGFRSLDDISAYFLRPNIGASDSPMTFLCHEVKRRFPDLRIVILSRPLDEVKASGRERGLILEDWFLDRLVQKSLDIIADFSPMQITYRDLEKETICAELFEYCLDLPFDREWWKSLRHVDIQSNVRAALRQIRNNDALRSFLVPAYTH